MEDALEKKDHLEKQNKKPKTLISLIHLKYIYKPPI